MKSQSTKMSRGSLAAQTRVNIETLRYYEKIGLMPNPMRSSGGHRIYDQTHLKRLSFIRRSRELGFTLQEIRELLDLVDGGDYTCAEVRDRTNRHLADVTTKIHDLRKIQRTLKAMSSKCDGGLLPECPIVDALYSD
jgi:MerR family mercuric resistance operon transcriptional regulator